MKTMNLHSCQSRSEVNALRTVPNCPTKTNICLRLCNSGRNAVLEFLPRKMLVKSQRIFTTLCESYLIGISLIRIILISPPLRKE